MITTMIMTKKERREKEIMSDFLNPKTPKQVEDKPMTAADLKKFIRNAKKLKPIFDRAEKEGRSYGER